MVFTKQTLVPAPADKKTASRQSGVCFAAYPSQDLANRLAQWIGCQRVIYNHKVREDRNRSATFKEAGQKSKPDRCYSHFHSQELSWLKEVPSQVLRNGSERWMEGKQRQLKGLAKAPTIRNRGNFNSVLVSSELFRFKETVNARTGEIDLALELGTKTAPVGVLPFKAHRPFGLPKQIVIRRKAGRWTVSFSYAHAAPEGFVERSDEELAYELNLLGQDELAATTLGLDRNVKSNCVATSDGRFFAYSPVQVERIKRKVKGQKRYQRRMARQVKGSKNSAKTRQRLARKSEYRSNVSKDFSHQTSYAIVSKDANGAPAPRLIVLEDLNIQGMVRRPKPKQDPVTGKWLPNGARAKAGLNRAILISCWGAIAKQVQYKAHRNSALVLSVPAAYSSQECSHCGHTHPGNRKDQRFVCQRCGYRDHADLNAAKNLAARGIKQVRDQKVVNEVKKRVAFKRKTKTGREAPGVPAESSVSRKPVKTELVRCSTKQELSLA